MRSAVAALLMLAAASSSESRELRASVVWTRADLVYLAAPDSGELLAGMTLSIVRGRRDVASAAITQLLDPRLAVARLSSGSLARERHIDKLHVRGEAAVAARVAVLRVGLPGRGRANLLFACGEVGVAPRIGATDYAVDSPTAGAFRLVRESGDAAAMVAPDTLLVRLFADAADEEIALERGELDAAVFWPGELSARMRGDPRWRGAARGVRARGLVACVLAAPDTLSAPVSDLAAVNRDVFGGDLLPWSELESDSSPAATSGPARWSVDPALPGARVLERVLARHGGAADARAARLVYLDVPLVAHDSAHAPWRTRGVTPVYAVRCPVLAAAGVRELVASLGADTFANLILCTRGTP